MAKRTIFLSESPNSKVRFAITGSNGRRLKRSIANMLAGRAFVRELFPLFESELASSFDLEKALAWGLLPSVWNIKRDSDLNDYLKSYVRTYIVEEIQREQVVRNLDPFRRFLEIAAQYNGKIINFSNIARGIHVDSKTVASYYDILEDTLIGSYLLPFDQSFRKRLIRSPKFYFFDIGVTRALARQLEMKAAPSTSYYGELFEAFIHNQIAQTIRSFGKEWKLSFFADESGLEIDFVVEKFASKLVFIEVKSTRIMNESYLKNFKKILEDFPNAEFQVWSNDPVAKKYGKIKAQHWKMGLEELFHS